MPDEAPISVEIAALTGTACGDPASPNAGNSPFAELSSLKVTVNGPLPGSGVFGELASKTLRLSEGSALTLGKIPEGTNREVVVVGTGAGGTWFGKDTGLVVRRNEDTAASVVLSKVDAFSCLPTPSELQNTLFSAAVSLGDGRVLVTGGFRSTSGSAIGEPTAQAFIYDSRNGSREFLGSMGAGFERGAHTMVHIPEANQVVILGGASELTIDTTRPFPVRLDRAKALDDAIIFDIATKQFRRADTRMGVGRAFPRAQLLADGTVLVTGGGEWPFVTGDDRFVEVDFYDYQATGGIGGFLEIPKLRSFYTRAGHSLSPLSDTAEGLSQLLIWGGTTADRSLGNPAEVYRQSGRQREGVNGTFAEVIIVGEEPTFLYFHETTPLTGNRFLVTGGGAHRDGAIQGPAEDEAWVLTYVSQPSPTIQAQRVVGFGAGRVFHSALSPDGSHVSVVGGWNGINPLGGGDLLKTFDLAALPSPWTGGATASSASRGGHAGILTPGGGLLLVGGEGSATPGSVSGALSAEIYTPHYLTLP